jgi:hypothetical protein
MPLRVYWESPEKTIIRCDSTGRWTWDEYHYAVNDIVALMATVTHRVYLINTTDNSPCQGVRRSRISSGRHASFCPISASTS